jgi:hypothetical protein
MRNPTSKLASLLLYSSSNYATYSAAKVLLCMRRSSTSRVLLTRKALWPDGIMWRVFLLEPNPIYNLQSVHALSTARAEVHDSFEASMSLSAFESTTTSQDTFQHTEGITIWPLNRLRTLLSIPLGFLQLASTHLYLPDYQHSSGRIGDEEILHV